MLYFNIIDLSKGYFENVYEDYELYVKNDNEKAISLYKKIGFEESENNDINDDRTYMSRSR